MLNDLFQRLSKDYDVYTNYFITHGIQKDRQIYNNIKREYNYIYNNYYDSNFNDDIYEIEDREYFNPNVYRYEDIVVKSVDRYNVDQFNGLIHECFVLVHISNAFPETTQSIIDIKLTKDTLFLITKLESGQTLESYLESFFNHNNNLHALINLLKNIFNVLGNLYKIYRFTHYDLHLQNIMVTDNGVKIIDFASCHVIIDGVSYGLTATYKESPYTLILPNYFWPYDIFKLLCLTREKFTYETRINEIQDKIDTVSYNYNLSIDKLYNIVKEFEKNIINNDYEEYDSMEEFNEFYEGAKDNLQKDMIKRDEELDKYVRILQGVNIIKDDIRYTKLLEGMISYFLDVNLIEQYHNSTKFYDAVRIDVIPGYDKYLSSYEDFISSYNI